MNEARVRVGDAAEPLCIRINGSHPTFRLGTDLIRSAALAELSPFHEDLVEIACTVFAADSSVRRGGDTRPRMGGDWRRRFAFTIPVRQPDFWRQSGVTGAIADAVGFLTDDSVSFEFISRRPEPAQQPFLDLDPAGAVFEAEEVILFSGGLDSYAGALEVLSTTSAKVLLLTHRSAQKVIPRQEGLGRHLSERFPGRVLHLQVRATRIGSEGHETTQRSRSFLFAALGSAVGHCFGAKRLSFYENGIISHNLPVSPQVIGTMATRTTHPLALLLLNRLLDQLPSGAGRIENRYAWLTKTDVLRRIEQNGGVGHIGHAVSCTSVREQTTLHTHCGACSQCLDRRFAVLAAGLADHDPEEAYKTDVLFGPRPQNRSTTMALEWTRHALRLGKLDDRSLIEAFGHELQRIIRGHPELMHAEVMNRIRDMHRRQSSAVSSVLEGVIHEKARDLVDGSLPATSLLAMHLSYANGTPALASDPRPSAQPGEPIQDDVEEDIVPGREAALVASFLVEGNRHVVSVEGLGRVEGQPAKVAHALKPVFDADRAEGCPPDDHRFVQPVTCPELNGLSKEAIRAAISRCRGQLRRFHEDLHGEPPSAHILIQGKQPRGYRLDPELHVIEPPRIEGSAPG